MSSSHTETPEQILSRRGFLKRSLIAAGVITLPAGLVACGGSGDGSGTAGSAQGTKATFAILSDPHLFDTASLGDSADLDAYLQQDRKMLKDSVQIFDAALADIKSRNVDFVLICGDLTKDGERLGHELMVSKLAALGKKAFVIPGNHDINNPDAKSFKTSPASPTASVTPSEFRQLYANFGYGSIQVAPDSLSYIAEPVNGLWLFAIDSCKYANNIASGSPVTSGAISEQTLSWIEQKLVEAQRLGKIPLGMMHHGIIEHFPGQSTLFPEYLVDDREKVAARLAAAGLQIMFTGHFHANDAISKAYGNNTLYDIETGSTVTAPSPYRLVTLDLGARQLSIGTSVVTQTSAHPNDFQAYAKSFLTDGLNTLVTGMLSHAPYNLQSAQIAALLPLIVPAMVAHYAGDEKLTDANVRATLTAMAASPDASTKLIGSIVLGLWSDPSPADNTLSIALATA